MLTGFCALDGRLTILREFVSLAGFLPLVILPGILSPHEKMTVAFADAQTEGTASLIARNYTLREPRHLLLALAHAAGIVSDL